MTDYNLHEEWVHVCVKPCDCNTLDSTKTRTHSWRSPSPNENSICDAAIYKLFHVTSFLSV